MCHFGHVVARKEAENVGVVELRDARGAGDGDKRHLVLQRHRQHRQHLRAEHRGGDGRDLAAPDGAFQRIHRGFRGHAGIGNLGANGDARRGLLERQHRAVALAGAFERQEAGNRHQHGVAVVLRASVDRLCQRQDHGHRRPLAAQAGGHGRYSRT
jgi:hypothetical protein